jgi:hypothetical protein
MIAACDFGTKETAMKKILSIAFSITLFSMIAWAAPLLFEKKGESFIHQIKNSDGLIETTIHTQDYTLLDNYSGEGNYESRLLDIKKDITTYENAEGVKGHLQLNLFKTVNKKFDTAVWQINEDATSWTEIYEPQLIVTELGGCCGAQNGARAFNTQTGKLLLSYTPLIQSVGSESSPFVLEVPNTPLRRLVGVLSLDSTRDFPPELQARDSAGYQTVAVVKYANLSGILQKFAVKIKTSANFLPSLGNVNWLNQMPSKNEVRGGHLTLWDQDGQINAQYIGGFSFEIEIYGENGEVTLSVPVSNDRFNLSKAELPEGVILSPL